MSIMYRLFGRPGNVGEFADRVLRDGEGSVEITLGDRRTDLGAGASFHHYPLVLKAGTCELEVDGDSALNVLGNPREGEVRTLVAEHNALVQATRVGRYLEKGGLSVSVRNKPVDETLGELEEFRQRIESKSGEYGLDLAENGAPKIWSLN